MAGVLMYYISQRGWRSVAQSLPQDVQRKLHLLPYPGLSSATYPSTLNKPSSDSDPQALCRSEPYTSELRLHIKGSPIPPLPCLPALKGLSPLDTALQHHRRPSNAAAPATGWALASTAQIPSSVQTATHPAPHFNMPKLCLVPPTPCTFAFCPRSTILSHNFGLQCASLLASLLVEQSPHQSGPVLLLQ